MKIPFTILLFLLFDNLSAQNITNQDISCLKQAFSTAPKPRLRDQFALSKENPNELQAVFSGLFLFYKSFFSSQDNQRCSFHPSCSEYGLEAVKKLGVIRGIVCTCDRLTRCNGLSPEQYELNRAKQGLNDPVKW